LFGGLVVSLDNTKYRNKSTLLHRNDLRQYFRILSRKASWKIRASAGRKEKRGSNAPGLSNGNRWSRIYEPSWDFELAGINCTNSCAAQDVVVVMIRVVTGGVDVEGKWVVKTLRCGDWRG